MIIDARGLSCPKPVMMAEEELSKMIEGIVEVLVDNDASAENLMRFARRRGFFSENLKENSYRRVKIAKGIVCEAPAGEYRAKTKEEGEEVKKQEKDLLLIISSDVIGKEEELGKVLMKAFLETMKATKEIPHTIFFLNAGVKLTTVNEETVAVLKEIERMGTEIFSCGTCLKYYNLESYLKVGYRGTSNHIVEGIKDFAKTVWIG